MSKVMPPSSQAGVRASSGRVRRPSEKVQLMMDDYQQEKVLQDREAATKAKKREERTRKRDQATKAAQDDPLKSKRTQAQGNTDGVHIMDDNAFTSRPAGGHAVTTPRTNLPVATVLVARKGKIPPPVKISMNAIAQLPPRVRVLSTAQSVRYEALKAKAAVTATQVTTTNNTTGTRKRVRERELTPYYPTENREAVDVNNTNARVCASASLPKESERNEHGHLPKKRARHVVPNDNDETGEGSMTVVVNKAKPAVAIGVGPQADTIKPTASNVLTAPPDEPEVLSQGKPKLAKSGSAGGAGGAPVKTRPKAGDYDSAICQILKTAIEYYHALLLTESPFPAPHTEVQWAGHAWDLACEYHNVPNITHDPTLMKLITARSSTLRGQFKTKARPIVASTFGFETGANPATYEKNRKLVIELKTKSAFIYRDRHPRRSGIYRNRGVQQLINEVLFKNKTDEGIKWARYYEPFPDVGYALAITAIECAIDEWASGTREAISFTEVNYSGIFNCNLESLEYFHKQTHELGVLPTLMLQVYNNGRTHAGVFGVSPANGRQPALPDDAIEDAIAEFEDAEGDDDNDDDVEGDEQDISEDGTDVIEDDAAGDESDIDGQEMVEQEMVEQEMVRPEMGAVETDESETDE